METQQIQNSCNETFYDQLFRKIAPSLRSFLYFRFKDLERAEDMVQEAFLTLWKNCEKVMPDMAKSYLYKVGLNQMIKAFDKEKTKQKHIHFIQKSVDTEDPQFALEFTEFDCKVQKAISDLPEGQREVFLLNRIEKRTYSEIAEMLEVSVKAVEKRMHKALLKLREVHKSI